MIQNAAEQSREILKLVEPIIARHQPSNYRLVPREAWFSKGLDAWVVSVDTEPHEVSAMDYTRRLAEIEDEVQQNIKDREIYIHVHPSMWRED